MEILDHLKSVAEVAVTLAGFSALVGLLGTRRRSGADLEAKRLQVMLEASLFVVAASLLPVVLFELRLADEVAWSIAAALFLLTDLGLNLAVWIRSRGLAKYYQPADRIVGPIVTTLGWTADAIVLGVLFAARPELAPGLYLLALYLNLVLAGILFIRFAASTFSSDDSPAV